MRAEIDRPFFGALSALDGLERGGRALVEPAHGLPGLVVGERGQQAAIRRVFTVLEFPPHRRALLLDVGGGESMPQPRLIAARRSS